MSSQVNVEGVPSQIGEFIKHFYATSDNRDVSLDEYTNHFHFDEKTKFRIGAMQTVNDKKSVEQWRSKAWDAVQSRKHFIYGVFSKSNNSTIDPSSPECMIYGRVEYTLKDGKTSGADWGGHIIFYPASLDQGSEPKMHSYNVWVTPDQSPKI